MLHNPELFVFLVFIAVLALAMILALLLFGRMRKHRIPGQHGSP